ncbi:MAG TPA: ABC transporter ATP-binding protein [Tepidisphaeraceae bacterium]|nr:ABC transporter ATP-binding protein [Tepidisphaeraceae bacterium]
MKTAASVPAQTKPNSAAVLPPPPPAAAVPLARAPIDPSKVSEGVTNAQLLLWMFGFLKPVKPLVFFACLYLSLWIGAEVMAVRQSGQAVNIIGDLRANPAAKAMGMWGWLFSADAGAIRLRVTITGLFGLVMAMAVLRYLREVANSKMSMTMVFYLREAVYEKLQRVGFAFHDAVSSGQLINRALTDLQHVRSFIQSAVLTTLEIVLIVAGFMILIFTVHPLLAALSLVPLPIWTWYILRFSKKVQPASKAVVEAEDKNVSIITENIAGVHVVKAFATERQEIAKFQESSGAYTQRKLNQIRMFANFQPIIRGIATASHLSLFLAAAILTIKGRLKPGDFVILGSAMAAILTRLQQVSAINEQYQNAIVSARRFYEVLMAPPTVPEKPNAKPLPPGPGAVSFEKVTFGYSPDKPVLRDVSFSVPGGKIVAICGPTGAGKTTLVNLITRFYDPHQGCILIDGVDIRDVSLGSLRTQVSLVFQETYLFSDTVCGNIAYGRPTVRGGEIEAAARLAQAHEFIEQLPKGYDTILGERGASLSGGQRQRLAIARAIFANPRVLILDDATAAVDPETEELIRKAMRFVMKDRTTFIIAHRISTVKRADLVIVLEEGRITQMGTHEQLMRQEGHYRDIAAVQLYGDVEEPEQEPEPTTAEHPSHMKRVHDRQHVSEAIAQASESDPTVDVPMGK